MGRDGRGPYILRDKTHAAQVIAATKAFQRGADLPLDYEHQSQRAPVYVTPRPASGWVKWDSLVVGPSGIWGDVEWTAKASQHLTNRDYRYFSPVFWGDGPESTGNLVRIVGGALTNFPNIDLPALASQGATMPGDTLTSAKALLGMDGADDTAFLKCVGDLAKLTTAFVTHLGLPPDTGAAGLLDALTQRAKAPAEATAAQATESALAAIQAVASQAETYRKQLSQTEIDKAVSDAMAAGKLSPAMRPWAVALASQTPESFTAFTKAMPAIFAHLVDPAARQMAGRTAAPPTGEGEHGLTAGQLAVCSQMNVSPEDYRKTVKG